MTSPLTAITSMATRGILGDLAGDFERRTGVAVELTAMGGVEAQRRLREGCAADLVFLAAAALDGLVRDGLVLAEGRTDYATSAAALAVPAGAPRPAIATPDDVRQAMLAGRRVAFSTGPSGDQLKALWSRWGIAEAMGSRSLLAPPGTPVAALLARGDADLGLQQLSELKGQPGIDILGELAADIIPHTRFAGAVGSACRRPQDARAFLAFLASGDAAEAIRRGGMRP
jgi:molybdate transport system substrate-binding protein